MIQIELSGIERIEEALNGMENKTPSVLKSALNATAKEARKELANKAKKTYAVKISGFNKTMKIKNATVGKMEAVIKARGEAMELGQFRASPFKVTNGADRPESMKGKVMTAHQMKALVKSDVKAFVVKFKSGHVAVVERVPGKKMKSNPKKEFLKKLLSPSIPQMVGNEKEVYGEIRPKIDQLLQENISRQIDRILGGRR